MAKTKLVILLLVPVLLVSCTSRFEWSKIDVDGHRTGVQAVLGNDFVAALGWTDTVYHAPVCRDFSSPSVRGVALALLKVQPQMIYLKEVLSYCPTGMTKGRPESLLGNWAADAIAMAAESIYHVPVDAAIMNLGGIRVDMPQGEVLLDDVLSMFPFANDIVCVVLKGSDVRALFEGIAQNIQAVSGVRMVIENKALKTFEIGGAPLDENKLYNIATIDFLLDGGDGIFAGRNAVKVMNNKVRISDWIVPYLRALGASGDNVESELDGRVKVL